MTATDRHYHRDDLNERIVTEIAREEYKNHAIVTTRTDVTRRCNCGEWESSGSYVDTRVTEPSGRTYRASTSKDIKAATRKARKDIDTAIADAEILPRVQSLIGSGPSAGRELADADLCLINVGSVAFVYAMGRMRRGLVTEISKRGSVEVAYTTATNPTIVYRKREPVARIGVEV